MQRLLELYARWQQRIFPHCKFDDFIVKLEKLGSSAIVKVGDAEAHVLLWARAVAMVLMCAIAKVGTRGALARYCRGGSRHMAQGHARVAAPAASVRMQLSILPSLLVSWL